MCCGPEDDCCGPDSCCQCIFKIFLFVLMLGPMLIPLTILLVCGLIANIVIIIYFALIGWICEAGLLDWHEKFIAESLSKPWYPLKSFFNAICKFCDTDLCGKKKPKEEVKEKESKIVNSRYNKKNKYNDYEEEEEDYNF